MMERRLSKESSRGSVTLQKKLVESRQPSKTQQPPDLTDFMNDMFFGTVQTDKKAYNLTGSPSEDDDEESFDDSTRSNSSRLTQEWLEEARRMMASSPTRCDSPTKVAGSPKFAAIPGRLSSPSVLDRRDPLSRSARRHKAIEGFSGEILAKSAKHSRNRSESLDSMPSSPSEPSPALQVQQWFSNMLKPYNPESHQPNDSPTPSIDPVATVLPRQPTYRKSRFQTEPTIPASQGVPVPSRRTFKAAPLPDTQMLSPPKNLIESAHRRSISSSTCSQPEKQLLSPPRNVVESAHRRSITRSTCSVGKIAPKPHVNGWQQKEEGERVVSLNDFLKNQRIKIERILNGEIDSKAKVILSGTSTNTSSMVAAICYAWLLENRFIKNKGEGDGDRDVVVPVMNVRRGRMWKQRQAAWLFHHVGLETTSLLFADEVDLESLIMAGKLTILVVGQDILKTDNEVGSKCTILTDNYCEDAYDLLQTPVLKKLLLAVIQDQRDSSFFETLRYNYGKPPSERGLDSTTQMEQREAERKSTSICYSEASVPNSDKKSKDVKNAKSNGDTPKSAETVKTNSDSSRGKSKFFLARWFGFGK
ncbi:uncharacterized protein LOC110618189 isoform X2 [Manihot esculenta]|uniref:Uncharacterized protein n=1 Tax=Manihot esculenta TaxID=3983 RepID=A0ACB7HLE6_MANES|nr:uncharacterized protein LOC110618189 isoform X2 [Manihot esculenta]KAG8652613.1 hypothetical protein MANES_06G111300v8 [Manihot esculenta]